MEDTITLRAARVNAGLSLEDVAEALSTNRQSLSNYERGINLPNVRMAVALCKLYKTPLERIREFNY